MPWQSVSVLNQHHRTRSSKVRMDMARASMQRLYVRSLYSACRSCISRSPAAQQLRVANASSHQRGAGRAQRLQHLSAKFGMQRARATHGFWVKAEVRVGIMVRVRVGARCRVRCSKGRMHAHLQCGGPKGRDARRGAAGCQGRRGCQGGGHGQQARRGHQLQCQLDGVARHLRAYQ